MVWLSTHSQLALIVPCPQENVQGSRCDQCRVGTFSLDAANPKGCTRCFCFGATERCGSSNHARHEVSCPSLELRWEASEGLQSAGQGPASTP